MPQKIYMPKIVPWTKPSDDMIRAIREQSHQLYIEPAPENSLLFNRQELLDADTFILPKTRHPNAMFAAFYALGAGKNVAAQAVSNWRLEAELKTLCHFRFASTDELLNYLDKPN